MPILGLDGRIAKGLNAMTVWGWEIELAPKSTWGDELFGEFVVFRSAAKHVHENTADMSESDNALRYLKRGLASSASTSLEGLIEESSLLCRNLRVN